MNISTLDKAFSTYIRLRDANDQGFCFCISCGKLIHWKKADAGHFINRKHMSLRFSEFNVNAQCRECNRFDEGNSEGYRRGLIKKHGDDIIDRLYASKHNVLKLGKFEMEILEKEFKNKIKELAK